MQFQLESWFVEMCVATAVVVVLTMTLLGREARQKKIALERQLQEISWVQQAEETILQHSVTPEETSLLSFMKELNVTAPSIERLLQARAGAGARTRTRMLLMSLAAGLSWLLWWIVSFLDALPWRLPSTHGRTWRI